MAGGPIPGSGGGGMAGDLAAAALRLSPGPGVTGIASGDAPPPPGGGNITRDQRDGASCPRRGLSRGGGQGGCTHPPPPPPAAVAYLQFALLDCVFFYTWREALVAGVAGVKAGVEGAGTKAPPHPHSPSTEGGTTASRCCGGGTARSPMCSPTPASDGNGPSPPMPLPPLRGHALGSRALGTSLLGLGTCGGRPTINARMPHFGGAPCTAPLVSSSGPRGQPLLRRSTGDTTVSFLPVRPARRPQRQSRLHVALVSGATVAGGDRHNVVEAGPPWRERGALAPP